MSELFSVHMLNEDGKQKAMQMADAFSDLLGQLTLLCGDYDNRLLAIVRTKLEEACFFAKKAMSSDPVNQQ